MGIKDFFLKQTLKYKLKDVPEAERAKIQAMIEAHPELFKKIGEEVQALTKLGQSEMAATMMVMRKHQAELQKLMRQ